MVDNTHGGRAARAARGKGSLFENELELVRLRSDVGDAAARRAVQTQSMNLSGQITTENALVVAGVVVFEMPEVGLHHAHLVVRARKVV